MTKRLLSVIPDGYEVVELCSELWLMKECCLQAALAVWIIILRFMGDLPEPKYHTAMAETKVSCQS